MRLSSLIYEIEESLDNAFQIGDIPKIKNLLLKPDLDNFEEFPHILGNTLKQACEKGFLDLVKFLLNKSELVEYIDINYKNGKPLICASAYGHLDIVKYLLTSPELMEHADIHIDNDLPFAFAAQLKQLHVLSYFILEINIPRTEHINQYLNNYPNPKIEQIFELRKINNDLNKDLISNKYNSNKKLKL
jgi:ankyrin repeat protein